jgi:ATP-dependent Lon protease
MQSQPEQYQLDKNTEPCSRRKEINARSITTDTGWKITLDRGLDIFQRFETGTLSLEQNIQEARLCRGAEISYIRLG